MGDSIISLPITAGNLEDMATYGTPSPRQNTRAVGEGCARQERWLGR